jgi:hypothetical protein
VTSGTTAYIDIFSNGKVHVCGHMAGPAVTYDNGGTFNNYTGVGTIYYGITLSEIHSAVAFPQMAAIGNYGTSVSGVPGLSSMAIRTTSASNTPAQLVRFDIWGKI